VRRGFAAWGWSFLISRKKAQKAQNKRRFDGHLSFFAPLALFCGYFFRLF